MICRFEDWKDGQTEDVPTDGRSYGENCITSHANAMGKPLETHY